MLLHVRSITQAAPVLSVLWVFVQLTTASLQLAYMEKVLAALDQVGSSCGPTHSAGRHRTWEQTQRAELLQLLWVDTPANSHTLGSGLCPSL